MKTCISSRFVKPEDLNHHNSLFAGRTMEWMIDACFIAIAKEIGTTEGIVYKDIHCFDYMKPVDLGTIVDYRSTIVRAGRSSVTVRLGIYNPMDEDLKAEGYLTYVTVEEGTMTTVPSGITLDEAQSEEEQQWRDRANSFFEKK